MPSLSQILREHSPLLLIDAASSTIQVGLLGQGSAARWASRKDEAGVGIFACLENLGADIGSVRAFAFCEGPGSILGIRTSAMALRTWSAILPRPLYAFCGLAVVAEAHARPQTTVIADARRGHWHCIRMGGALGRVPASDLSGDLATPEGFRTWDPLPAGTVTLPYSMEALLASPAVAEADLFSPTQAPDAFLHGEPTYVKWVPQIHRAP